MPGDRPPDVRYGRSPDRSGRTELSRRLDVSADVRARQERGLCCFQHRYRLPRRKKAGMSSSSCSFCGSAGAKPAKVGTRTSVRSAGSLTRLGKRFSCGLGWTAAGISGSVAGRFGLERCSLLGLRCGALAAEEVVVEDRCRNWPEILRGGVAEGWCGFRLLLGGVHGSGRLPEGRGLIQRGH